MNRGSSPRFRAALALALYALTAAASAVEWRVGAGTVISLGTANVDLGEGDLAIDGAVDAAGSALAVRDLLLAAGGSLDGGTARITVCGNWVNDGAFTPGAGTVALTDGCRATSAVLGSSTFSTLTIASATGKRFEFAASSTQTVVDKLAINGEGSAPVVLRSTVAAGLAFLHSLGATNLGFVDIDDISTVGGPPIALDPDSVLGANAFGFFLRPVLVPVAGAPFVLLLLAALLAVAYRIPGRKPPAQG